eukprot:851955-Pyramimonas_sp.AAC.1
MSISAANWNFDGSSCFFKCVAALGAKAGFSIERGHSLNTWNKKNVIDTVSTAPSCAVLASFTS